MDANLSELQAVLFGMTESDFRGITPVSKFSKSKSAYKQKKSNANPFFEDIWFVSKAAKNNSCQTVMPITKRDC